jgi:3-hydroxyacyl-[acyl-carrier-protein] dehydratase
MPPEAIFDLSQVDLSHVLVDREGIRQYNPQRFEMEQLDAIVYMDAENKVIVGYKDVRPDEFWVRGHMPDYPLMPGVLMCEAAAQLCSYFVHRYKLVGGDFLGFQGLENVRFRSSVHPGDRLVLVSKMIRIHPRQTSCTVQGYVKNTMVFNGDILGVPLFRQKS